MLLAESRTGLPEGDKRNKRDLRKVRVPKRDNNKIVQTRGDLHRIESGVGKKAKHSAKNGESVQGEHCIL
jgi:hypothetical protein